MRNIRLLAIVAVLVMFAPTAITQTGGHHFPTPPEPMAQQPPKEGSPTLKRHVDFNQVQQEADELARTAQTVPADVVSIRRGMLPKDAIEKLKQIEKLSKKLRTELGQ